jgi:very-short-patch-repair endonuclease
MKIFNIKKMKARRRELRNKLTPSEARLWKYIQKRQINGKRFRRQFSVGGYVLDFYCPMCKLAIEIDGASHDSETAQKYDKERTKYLYAVGIKVIRFKNIDILKNLYGVLEEIKKHLTP